MAEDRIKVKRNARSVRRIHLYDDNGAAYTLEEGEEVRLQIANEDHTDRLVSDRECEVISRGDSDTAAIIEVVLIVSDFTSANVQFSAQTGSTKIGSKQFAVDIETKKEGQSDWDNLVPADDESYYICEVLPDVPACPGS